MKVYKFFKIPNIDEKDNDDIERKYVLYAITNNKDYADRFKEDRNMKKFIFKVHKGVTKDEYSEMCNNDRGAVLEYVKLTTIFNDNHTYYNKTVKEVLMTYWEKQLISEPDTLLEDENIWRHMPYPLIFKQKYVNMLNTLQYINYYKLMSVEFLPFRLSQQLAEFDDENGDYAAPNIIYDEVALFIRIIRDTL